MIIIFINGYKTPDSVIEFKILSSSAQNLIAKYYYRSQPENSKNKRCKRGQQKAYRKIFIIL